MKQEQAVVVGSLSDVAAKSGMSIAESFISATAIILVDVSGSMHTRDSRGSKSRYDVALDELAVLQRTMPGRLAVIAFSDGAIFVPGGVPSCLAGGTDVAAALRFAKVADVPDMRFFLISDGEPNDAAEALAVAATFTARIDTIFVGPERGDRGRDFLERLAAATGGQSATAECVKELAETTKRMLLEEAHR